MNVLQSKRLEARYAAPSFFAYEIYSNFTYGKKMRPSERHPSSLKAFLHLALFVIFSITLIAVLYLMASGAYVCAMTYWHGTTLPIRL